MNELMHWSKKTGIRYQRGLRKERGACISTLLLSSLKSSGLFAEKNNSFSFSVFTWLAHTRLGMIWPPDLPAAQQIVFMASIGVLMP